MCFTFFFFKQKTAYEMRISDWSSDVCSSDLKEVVHVDEIRLIFQRIGHIIRIGHGGGSVRFAVEPDFGDAFVAVLIGIEEIDVDLMALDIALDKDRKSVV